MDTLPAIGSRVLFPGNSVIGRCEGVVERHYPSEVQDEDGNPIPGHFAPHSAWKVRVGLEQTPARWPYGQGRRMAATVADLTQV
jgi:hypothetical protein